MMQPPKEVYLRSNENVLRAYPRRALATYYYLKARFPNSAIYAGYRGAVAARTGWKQRTFFNRVALLVGAGLARRDSNGDVRLLPLGELVGSANPRKVVHLCTVRVREDGTERDVRDELALKLLEEKHRQVRHASARARATGIKGHRPTRAPLTEVGAYRVRSDEHSVKTAELGFEAMSCACLQEHLGLSRNGLNEWKRRARERGDIRQLDRRRMLPDTVANRAMLRNLDLACPVLGGFVYRTSGGWMLARPSMYRPERGYSKPLAS